MITIGYSTRQTNPTLQEYFKKSCGIPKCQVIEKINPNGKSLTEVYNEIINESENDIIVLCHDDIYFEKSSWGNKILKHFKKNPDYGILGVAGSTKMPESGMWWEDKRKMRGIVNHEHEGRKWESKYSSNIGNLIDDVVLVDGLFLVINKEKYKEKFNEEVKGFHFYDVDFSFRNYINGVKIGVIYDVRVTHKSIGQTNQEWEDNRKIFAEREKDNLPQILKDDFKNRPLRVLLGVLNFQSLTGSELSTLELAKGLSKNGCEVSVLSTQVSDNFKKICKQYNIKTYTTNEPPGYKMGDGVMMINTPQGPQVMEQGKLYRMQDNLFDVIQTNHTPITDYILKLYPDYPLLTIVRSEVIELENPIIDKRIKHYIAIRPSIKDYIVNNFDVPEENVSVLYNPFDNKKFKKCNPVNNEKETILFVGTMDYLRKESIEHLIEKVNSEDKKLWLVGKDTMGYASEYSKEYDRVEYFLPTDKIEEFYCKCDVTAGIMLGRTTIEGFLCGKPAWIYNVDSSGHIKDYDYHEVPKDLSIFDYNTVINKFREKYIEVYNN
jgi:hypothetical protein